jgi:hypothetical protein
MSVIVIFHQLSRRAGQVGDQEVEYMAKDTKTKQFVLRKYRNEEFVDVLMQHVPDHGRHAMRYFGLLSPRSKAQLWAAIFVLLNQPQRPHPRRSSWRWLRITTFGTDPLLDSLGRLMHRVGRQAPVKTD